MRCKATTVLHILIYGKLNNMVIALRQYFYIFTCFCCFDNRLLLIGMRDNHSVRCENNKKNKHKINKYFRA